MNVFFCVEPNVWVFGLMLQGYRLALTIPQGKVARYFGARVLCFALHVYMGLSSSPESSPEARDGAQGGT